MRLYKSLVCPWSFPFYTGVRVLQQISRKERQIYNNTLQQPNGVKIMQNPGIWLIMSHWWGASDNVIHLSAALSGFRPDNVAHFVLSEIVRFNSLDSFKCSSVWRFQQHLII